MRYNLRKTDSNQAVIVRMLEWTGHHVTDLSAVGGGVPDLLCTRNGNCFLVEIKNRAGLNRFTDKQLEYYQQVKAPVYIIRDVNDVESLVNGDLEPINTAKTAINGSKKEHRSPAKDAR